jgi:general L-amino acid transport system substrate-binding protein
MEMPMRLPALTTTLVILTLAAAVGGAASGPAAAQTLKAVQDRGTLVCGVSEGIAGFSAPTQNGSWAGFDVDFCRALAAAIFDDAGKVRFVPLSADDRFRKLGADEVDVLSRNSSWTMSRESALGLLFAAVTFYDGQGFMVRQARNVGTALELGGSKVCVQGGTTTELNLADYFNANGMKYEAVSVASPAAALKTYDSGGCDVLTSDVSQLHAQRATLARPGDHVILPEVISKEPLGPAVRQGDPQWFNIVKWTHFAMLNAEEAGVSSKTIEAALKSAKPDIKRLVGTDGNFGEQIGLTKDWVVRIVRHVGNYAEVYDRNVGVDTPLGIPRGLNHLWSMGGILYAPPIR